MKRFDVIVIGGGMTGAATALGLAKQGKCVALIEREAPVSFDPEQPMDLRVSALSPASVALLQSLEAWDAVKEMRFCPYRRLETWEHAYARLTFHAESLGLPELGFIVENRVIQLALWAQSKTKENLTLLSPACVINMTKEESGHRVELDNGEVLQAPCLVGADGANSAVREYANIGVTAWDYRQHCLLIHVKSALPQQDITWQYFTPRGPRAFLPLQDKEASLVWYDTPSRVQSLCAMPLDVLKEEIITHFPKELGEIEVIKAGAFPLTRRHAQTYVKNNVVLIGDAAHTIHPLAGQGVNLGFKDVTSFLFALECAKEKWHCPCVYQRYEKERKLDNHMMQLGMDLFYAGFSNECAPLKIIRNAGLKMANKEGLLKRHVLKYALGL